VSKIPEADPRIRATDVEEHTEEWRKRAIPFVAVPTPGEPNGAVRRIRLVANIAKDIGGGTLAIIMLLIVFGWFSGYIPFPLFTYISAQVATEALLAQKLDRLQEQQMGHQKAMQQQIRVMAAAFRVMCENQAQGTKQLNNCQTIRLGVDD
jgi:hypothetical protein